MGSSRRGGSGKDGFVHIAAVEKVGVDLREGDKVTYDVVPSKGKESAGEVKALIGRHSRRPDDTEAYMAKEDEDILAHFKEQLVQSKHAPTVTATTREDFIERAQENFGTFFSFIQSIDEVTKAELGGGDVTLEFGDYNDSESTLDAFITISPPDASHESLRIGIQFQGKRMQINNSSFKKSSGSQFFDSDDLLDAKERLAGAVLGWMKK